MSHGKRTKKDVEEAYRRGFQAGFNVRPNPLAQILRAIWRKHEQKKLKKAWEEEVKAGPRWNRPIGQVTSVEETPDGLIVKGILNGP